MNIYDLLFLAMIGGAGFGVGITLSKSYGILGFVGGFAAAGIILTLLLSAIRLLVKVIRGFRR